jgi:predicted nucleotide-binding protein
MDKKRIDEKRAIELLKQALREIPHLKGLRYDNQEFILWFDKVQDIIQAGLDENDRQRFPSSRKATITTSGDLPSDADFQRLHLSRLDDYETALQSIVQKYEMVGLQEEPTIEAEPPKVFIAHGGRSAKLSKLGAFLEALGVEPLVVEIQPSEGRLTEEQVDEYMKQADCAIILATYGHIEDVKTRKKHPRLNVVDELGRCRKVFPDRTILLLEEGVDLPSNVSGIIRERFTKQNMEDALVKVAKELRAFGLIRPIKPAR